MKTLVIISIILSVAFAQTYRSYDGVGNNVDHPRWGANGSPFLHPKSAFYYEDGISEPRGGGYQTAATLPEERFVRDSIIRGQDAADTVASSDWAWVVGEYLAFETVRTSGNASEPWNFILNPQDPWYAQHNGTVDFKRCVFAAGTGLNTSDPRVQTNGATPFIDAQTVYGENNATAFFLRNGTGGLLKYQMGPDGEIPTFYGSNPPVGVTPFNPANNVNSSQLFALGSPRVNQQPQAMCFNILWRREHNRQARLLAAKNASWDDETLYQEARKRVIALMEHFYETEYMPMLLGSPNLAPYNGYDPNQDPSVNLLFNTVSLRYGHTQVSNVTYLLDEDRNTVGTLLLRDIFFDPTYITEHGCSDMWRGLNGRIHHTPETGIVEDLKEFVFAKKGFVGVDLLSTNMRRARDMGLPTFNEARRLYGLQPYSNWSFTEHAADFQAAYNSTSPENCDPWVCAILEQPPTYVTGGELGELNYIIVKQQFEAIRNGDRYWYNATGQFSDAELQEIQATKLAHIILRNSNVKTIKCNVFEVPNNPYDVAGPDCTTTVITTTGTSAAATTAAAATTSAKSTSSAVTFSLLAVLLLLAVVLSL